MNDVVVPLLPLILLLLVLLFGFVGCGLDATGAGALHPPFDTPVTLHIADIPTIATDLWSVKLTFEFKPTKPWGDITTHRTLTPEEITPNQFIDDFNVAPLNVPGGGTVSCTCVIEFGVFGGIDSYPDPDATQVVTEDQEKVDGEPLAPFTLTRDGNTFSLFVGSNGAS